MATTHQAKTGKTPSKTSSPTLESLQQQIQDLTARLAEQNQAAVSSSSNMPLAYKPTPAIDNSKVNTSGELFVNQFDIPKNLRSEIMKKGYNYKFINFEQYRKNTVHRSQWVPYRPELATIADTVFGKTPEGYIVRGDCVLAVRPLAIDKAHKDRIADKIRRTSDTSSQAQKALQKVADEHGVSESHVVGDSKLFKDDED